MPRPILCLAAIAPLAIAAPCLAASQAPPGMASAYSAPGTYKLIPLPGSKVPAAWVLNTQTGQTWLCGTGAVDGRARVTCLQADMNATPREQQ